MTVAAGIEIGTGGRPEPSPSQVPASVPGKAQSAARIGAGAPGSSSSLGQGWESFRSNWQSQLASLGAVDASAAEEAGADGTRTSVASGLEEAAGSESPATSNLAGSAFLPLSHGNTQQVAAKVGVTGWLSSGSRAGISSGRIAAAGSRQAGVNLKAKNLADARPAESAGGTRPAKTGKSAKPEPAGVGSAPSLVTAIAENVPPAIPVYGAESPVANRADVQQSPLQTVLTTALPTGLALNSFSSQAPLSGGPEAAVGRKSAGGNQAADRAGGPEAHSSAPDGPGAGAGATSAAGNQAATGLRVPGEPWSNPDHLFAAAGQTNAPGMRAADSVATAVTPGKASLAPTPGKYPLPGLRAGAPSEEPTAAEASARGGPGPSAADETASSAGRISAQAEERRETQPQNLGQNQIQAQPGSQPVGAVAAAIASQAADQGFAVGNAAASESVPSPAVDPMVGQPGRSGGGRVSARATEGMAHAPSMAEPVQHANHSLVGQSGGPGGDAFALARDPAGTPGPMNAADGNAGGSTGAAAEPAVGEAFSALDAEAAPGTPSWIHAGGRRAEAGFQDPDLGWVGVRAEMAAGGIHAALVPDSAAAAQALGGHLAGLNAYLSEQHTPVETLTLAAPHGRGAEQAADQGLSQGMHQGSGQDSQQGAYSDPQSDTQLIVPAIAAAAAAEVSAQVGRQTTTAQVRGTGDGHISVIA